MNSLVCVRLAHYFSAVLFWVPHVCKATHTLVLANQSPSYLKSLVCELVLEICSRSSPHQSQSNFLQLGETGDLAPMLPWQPTAPLCIWSVCCHSSPVELSCQSVSHRRRVNQRSSHPERPSCLHLLPWHRNSVLDRSGMAGSRSLYLPTCYIELSLPRCCVREQTMEAKAEKVDVKIMYWDLEAWCA